MEGFRKFKQLSKKTNETESNYGNITDLLLGILQSLLIYLTVYSCFLQDEQALKFEKHF